MAIETTEALTTLAHSLVIAAGKGIFTADMIVAAAMPATGVARGDDLLTVLNTKLDAGDFIESGTSLPVASETAKLIFYRTDERAFYFKQRTGAAAPYTYSWLGPVDKGDYQLRLLYHTAAEPQAPVISWNWQTETFNVTGGGWTLDTANAKWLRIVSLPADSNAASVSPAVRLGAVTAADVSVIAPDGDGHLPSSISNLQELTNWIDNDAQFGGTGTSTPSSDELLQVIKYEAPSSPPTFQAVDSYVEQTFSIDADLRDYQTTFGERLFAETVADLNIQGTNDAGDMSVRLELRDSAGAVLSPPVRGDLAFTVPGTSQETHHRVRCAGVLPSNFTGGSWRVTVLTNAQDSPKLGWVAEARIDVHPEVTADEVTVDAADYGNNLLSALTLNNVGDAISQIDELPLAFADYEDVAWSATGVDIGGALNQRQMDVPIHQKIQDVNARPTQQFIARILYDVNYISGSRTDGGTTASYVHEVRSDADNYAAVLSRRLATQGVTPTRVTFDVAVPSGATRLRVTFAEPLNESNVRIDQHDARLNVANYALDYEKGIETTGFTTSGRIINVNARSLQTLAQQLYDYVPVVGAATAAATSVDTTEFSDPNVFPGGLRETGIPGTQDTPANVQQALDKTDALFQNLDDPFRANQVANRLVASVSHDDFIVNSGTALRSEPIDIPQELRDLGVDIAIRFRTRLSAITAPFDGHLSLVDCDSPYTILDGTMTHRVRQAGTSDVYVAGDFITFQEVIAAAQVPDTFCIQYTRTSGTGSATFHRGVSYMVDASGRAGGAAGAADGGWELVWTAGPGNADRRTASSGSVNLNFISGKRADMYSDFEIEFDTNATPGAGITEQISYPSYHQKMTSGLAGTQGTWILIRGNFYKLIKPISQTVFRIVGGHTNVGIRALRGKLR